MDSDVSTVSRLYLSSRASIIETGFAAGSPQIVVRKDFPCRATVSLTQVSPQGLSSKQSTPLKTHHKLQIAGLFALVSLISILSCPDSAFALGFALPDQDAFAMARGNAFVATADDPAAVYYNPAGISQLEGTYFRPALRHPVMDRPTKAPAGEMNSKEQLAALPQVFSTMSLPYGFTFGLGTYSPYGLSMEWPDNSHPERRRPDGRN